MSSVQISTKNGSTILSLRVTLIKWKKVFNFHSRISLHCYCLYSFSVIIVIECHYPCWSRIVFSSQTGSKSLLTANYFWDLLHTAGSLSTGNLPCNLQQ